MSDYIKSLFKVFLFSMFCTSGAISETQKSCVSDPRADDKVYMSFSGGGYHAHAGASGVMMSLMDRVRSDNADVGMCDITKNVGAFSSNSGGSWFLSQAAYTDKFRTFLETKDAVAHYTSNEGYFGQASKYIENQIAKVDIDLVCLPLILDKTLHKKCIADLNGADSYLKFLLSGIDPITKRPNWHLLAKNAVFGQGFEDHAWNMNDDVSGSLKDSVRQPWARDKSLIFASALLTDAPALKIPAISISKFPLKIASLQAFQHASEEPVPGAAPVMFTVLADGATDTKPPFLLGGTTSVQYGHWDIGAGAFDPDESITPVKLGEINFDNANIIDVAASSSAAGAGFIDIPNMVNSHLPPMLGALLDNFAPAFTFAGEKGAQYTDVVREAGLKKISENQVVRLADGGFVDNTAVAHMLRYLAENEKLVDGFDVLAMDNYPAQALSSQNGSVQFPTGPDVAGLFGYPNPNNTTHTAKMFGVLSYTGLVPHVFESSAYFNEDLTPAKEADWCAWIEPYPGIETKCVTLDTKKKPRPHDKHCNMYLSYTQYKVTVRENENFGILSEYKGVSGNLHVFSVLGENAGVVPAGPFQDQCYAKLMEGIQMAVTGDYLFGNKLASLLKLN